MKTKATTEFQSQEVHHTWARHRLVYEYNKHTVPTDQQSIGRDDNNGSLYYVALLQLKSMKPYTDVLQQFQN
jgi:hypothetical protein